jgi:hypothetical protein
MWTVSLPSTGAIAQIRAVDSLTVSITLDEFRHIIEVNIEHGEYRQRLELTERQKRELEAVVILREEQILEQRRMIKTLNDLLVQRSRVPFLKGLFVEGEMSGRYGGAFLGRQSIRCGLTFQTSEVQLDVIPAGMDFVDGEAHPLYAARLRWYVLGN